MWEQSVGIVGFKIRVEVDAPVFGILVTVQTGAILAVGVGVADFQVLLTLLQGPGR